MNICVSGKYTQLLACWLVANKIEAPALREQLQKLAQRDRVSATAWRQVLAQAANYSSYPHFGLEVGSQATLASVGVIGYLMLNSETLLQALRTYQLSERRFYDVNFCNLSERGDCYTLSWPDKLGDENALFVQVSLATLVKFLRQRFPTTFELRQVALTEQQAGAAAPYEKFFGCPVVFGSDHPGISVGASLACLPEQGLLPDLVLTRRDEQKAAFNRVVDSGGPFFVRLQHALLRLIPTGEVALQRLAQDMDCSSRTLQRKLAEHNLSYQELLDGVREQLACRFLLQNELSFVDQALLLGFSEQSAFNRAFKKWTGLPPGAYQRKLSGSSKLANTS